MNNWQKSEMGFTLVELAIVMAIVGIVMGAAIRFAIPLIETSNHLSTTEKMNKIAGALSLYAVQNYRIPCPAIPVTNTSNPFASGFGFEQNNGTAQPNASSRCGGSATAWRGIVPFKTLGLPEEIIKDAWGHYFTYAVSPAFTLPPARVIPGNDWTSVQARCRTREWFYMTNTSPAYRPRNAAKAGFCCPGDQIHNAASNIIVRNDAGDNVIFRSRNDGMSGTSIVADADQPYTDITDPETYVPLEQTPVGIAFLLISHGSNGAGTAFDGVSNTRGAIPSSSAKPCEEENADDATGDRIYRDCALAEEAASEANDDITLWRTQDMIFASEGQSCATP